MADTPIKKSMDLIAKMSTEIPIIKEFDSKSYPDNYEINAGNVIHSEVIPQLYVGSLNSTFNNEEYGYGQARFFGDLSMNIPDSLLPYLKFNLIPILPEGMTLVGQEPLPYNYLNDWVKIMGDGQVLFTGLESWLERGSFFATRPLMPKSETNTITLTDHHGYLDKVYCKYQEPVYQIQFRPGASDPANWTQWLSTHSASAVVSRVLLGLYENDSGATTVYFGDVVYTTFQLEGNKVRENVIYYGGQYVDNTLFIKAISSTGITAECSKVVTTLVDDGNGGTTPVYTVSRVTHTFSFSDANVSIKLYDYISTAPNYEKYQFNPSLATNIAVYNTGNYWGFYDAGHRFRLVFPDPGTGGFDFGFTTMHPYIQLRKEVFPDSLPFKNTTIDPGTVGKNLISRQEPPIFMKVEGFQRSVDVPGEEIKVNKYLIQFYGNFKVKALATDSAGPNWNFKKGTLLYQYVITGGTGSQTGNYQLVSDGRTTYSWPNYCLPQGQISVLLQIYCTNPELLRLAKEYVVKT